MLKVTRICCLSILVVVLLGAISSTAHAQLGIDNCAHFGFRSPYLSSWYEMPYSMGRIPTPPYFALHPPVYYSVPVPRTYGYSPYAYPGTMQTPDVTFPSEPMEVINPHVTPEEPDSTDENSASKPSGKHVARSQPKVIYNPYVTESMRRPVELALSQGK